MFRKIAIAATAATLLGSAAAANEFGILDGVEEGATFYDVPLATLDAAGMVQIEDEEGTVLGMADASAGPNTDLRIDFTTPVEAGGELVAKIIVGGEVVDIEMIEIDG
ncbi:MAG: hypothetical protein AAFP13_14150 [Pseudomonadota bacterium]